MARLVPAAVRSRNPRNDPLHDRRGDLMGRNAVYFAATILAAIAVIALALIVLRPQSAPGGASTSGRPSAQPSSPALSAEASSSPSIEPDTPSPSRAASAPPPATPPESGVGSPFELSGPQGPIGTVTVSGPEPRRRVAGQTAPDGSRWLVILARYQATGPLGYGAADWQLEDAEGDRYTRAEVDTDPRLGSGRLEAGRSREGTVTFAVPEARDMSAIVLTDGDGDVVIFRTP